MRAPRCCRLPAQAVRPSWPSLSPLLLLPCVPLPDPSTKQVADIYGHITIDDILELNPHLDGERTVEHTTLKLPCESEPSLPLFCARGGLGGWLAGWGWRREDAAADVERCSCCRQRSSRQARAAG